MMARLAGYLVLLLVSRPLAVHLNSLFFNLLPQGLTFGGPVGNLTASGVGHCAMVCLNQASCLAFSYNTSTRRCHTGFAARGYTRRIEKPGFYIRSGPGLTDRWGWKCSTELRTCVLVISQLMAYSMPSTGYNTMQKMCDDIYAGSELVTIETQAKQAFLEDLLLGQPTGRNDCLYYLTGGNRLSGRWQWEGSRKRVTWFNWGKGQPDGRGHIAFWLTKSGQWGSIAGYRQCFICQRHLKK